MIPPYRFNLSPTFTPTARHYTLYKDSGSHVPCANRDLDRYGSWKHMIIVSGPGAAYHICPPIICFIWWPCGRI